MDQLSRKEMIIRYGTLGFVLCAILVIIQNLTLLYSQELSLSFANIQMLHQRLRILYLFDALPIPGIVIGYLIGRWRYHQINQLSNQVHQETVKKREIRRFTDTLIAGDLNTSISFSDDDHNLSETLIKLKDSLLKNRDSERQRRLEERQRNWVSEGLAEFGDILRTHAKDLEQMGYAVISGLVRYLDANQGAIFLTEEETEGRVLQMKACYAYNRKKFPDKRINWGEGLIGAVAMEKKGYYTEKIPDGYLTITSGLGKANPSYLLIEPLLWNDKVFGILEIASFKSIGEHQIQFVGRVAENIATTINTMESTLKTELLLKETQAQTEQLSKQEEQVRQNMEALKLTQEEAASQAEKFISFTNTVNHTLMRAEYDTRGMLLYANTRFLKKLGYSGNREVEGRHISMFIDEKDHPWFNTLFAKLAEGGRHYEGYMKHETKMGQDLWTMATYTCVRRDDGNVDKILFLAIDTTDQKKQSLDFEGQIEAIDRLSAKVIFFPDGKMQLSNELFRKTLKYTEKELTQMNVFDFFGSGEQERFNEVWEKVIRGEAFQGQLIMQSKYEEELWFRATFTSVDDMYGEVEKVIFLANEITKEKEMELASRKQHEQLLSKEEELRLSSLDLKKKLEETNLVRKQEKQKFDQELIHYSHIQEESPFPVVTVNNLGFILFFNRQAEKLWKLKQKNVIGTKIALLFHESNESQVITSFADPARSKTEGTFKNQPIMLPEGTEIRRDIKIVQTDLLEEVHYTLFLLQH